MTTISDMINSLQGLNVRRESLITISQTSEQIAILNREQLAAGFDSETRRLKPSYKSKKYAAMKNRMNPEPGLGNPDLILSGTFVSSIEVDVGSEEFEIIAEDINNLVDRYGDNIFGLTENNQQYYNEEIFQPQFMKAVRNQIGV